jgi:hypothetical protein
MKTARLEDAILDLLWSAWTELGVPGARRSHHKVALDPEPLVVFTPALAQNDPRLIEQVTRWCERHGHDLTKTRLDGIQRKAPKPVVSSFVAFAGTLEGAAALWVHAPGVDERRRRGTRSGPIPIDRPALARLRMRSLAGKGARADVLCELLGSSSKWTSTSDLQHLGYARLAVARILADLASANLATEKPGKGPAAFRLRYPLELSRMIQADGLVWPDLAAILELAWRLAELEASSARSGVLAPVKARDAWGDLHRLSSASGANEPPRLTGDGAWPAILQWGLIVLRNWPPDAPRAST